MKRLFSILLVLATTLSPELFAQSEVSYTRGATQSESILPPSPEAASAVKYAGVPFTHCLGAAEYEVPLYELKGHQLSIPISLTYLSNGIRVDEIAGVAGLGWTLNAGGCITREVVYMPDEYSNWSFYARPDDQLLLSLNNLTWNTQTELFIDHTRLHQQDVAADRYSYCVGGVSGTFIVTPSKTIIQLTGDGVVINPIQSEGLNGPITAFRITGPDGTVYYFNDCEISTRKNQKVVPAPIGSGPNIEWSAVTAWYLTSITSADQTETAVLSYSNGGIWNRSIRDCSKSMTVYTVNGQIDLSQPTDYSSGGGYVESTCNTRVLSSISLRGTAVNFTYATQYTNTLHKAGSRIALSNYPKRLTGISVTSPLDSTLVSYSINTIREPKDGRIVLSGINQYHGNELTDRWSFTYQTLPHQIYRYSQDWFGFYNKENLDDEEGFSQFIPGGEAGPDGSYTNIGPGVNLGPGFDPVSGGSGGSGQNNDDYRPRGNLSPYKINQSTSPGSIVLAFGYPVSEHAAYMSLIEANHDGARTTFDYEGAYIGSDGNQDITLGIRVKTIKVFDGYDLIQCRSFRYADPTVDGVMYPNYYDYVTVTATEGTVNTGYTSQPTVSWEYNVHEGSTSSGASPMTSRVLYGLVSERIHPSPQDTVGVRTVYTYDISASVRTEHGVSSRIPNYAAGVYAQPTEFNPSETFKSSYISNETPLHALLSRKDSYRVNSAGLDELYESEEYFYKHFGAEWVLVDYNATEILTDGVLIGNVGPGRIHHYPVFSKRVYGASPSQVVKVGYHSSGNDSTVINYRYVTRQLMEKPIRKAEVWIPGSDAIRRVSYEYSDTTHFSGDWIDALAQRHSLLEPIVQSHQKIIGVDTTHRIDIETEYDWFTSGVNSILQQKVKRERLNGLECWNEIVLSRDGYGNITALKERGKPLLQIQWGYDGLYPTSISEGSGNTVLSSSFIWSPGIGLLQETAPNGVSKYYEYDNAGQLLCVKNTDGHTIEQYEYGLLNNGDNLRYILKRTYAGINGNVFTDEKTWWNTLGLKKQAITTGASGNGDALLSAWTGDYLLHEDVVSWLPSPVSSWNGNYIDNADSLAIDFHGNNGAYHLKGYEQSLREKQLSYSYPGYHDYPSYETEDVKTGYPRYRWTDNGIIQDGIYPDHEVIATTYTDADGRNQIVIRDRFGNTLGTKYGQGTTSYIYDSEGRLRAVASGTIALTDTLNMWRYSYDSLGRIKSKGIPGSIREFYAYDHEDRVVSKRRSDETTTINYDGLGRIVTVYLNNGLGPQELIEQHWYDTRPSQASGLLSIITPAYSGTIQECGLSGMETFVKQAVFDENGVASGTAFSSYKYDKEGRKSRIVTLRNGSNTVAYSEEFRYDFRGNPIKSAYKSGYPTTGWDVLKIETDYDLRERPVRTESWLNIHGTVVARDTTFFTYDNLGRQWKTTSSSGGPTMLSENAYTLQGFLSERKTKKDGIMLFSEALKYDNPSVQGFSGSHSGLITQIQYNWASPGDNLSPPTIFPKTIAFIYDSAGRVVKSGGYNGVYFNNPLIKGELFSYDISGDITSHSEYVGNAVSLDGESYYYNGHLLDRLVKTQTTTPPATISHTDYFVHDNMGRMTSDGLDGIQISYNHMDLPAIVSSNGSVLANYSYLADGTKVCSINDSGVGLVYCGPMVYRRNSSGSLSFEDASICSGRITAAGVRYNVTDHLGSVRGIIRGSDGALLECNDFSLYGTQTSGPLSAVTNTETHRYHFSGKEDQSVDFSVPYTDFGARHYSPGLRRWLTPDPKSEDYYEISPYAYCAGDPVNLVDDDGKKFKRTWRNGTITISQTFYASKSSMKSAQLAVNYWNNRKFDTYQKDGKEYTIRYKLNVLETEHPEFFSNVYQVEQPGSIIDDKTKNVLAGQTRINSSKQKVTVLIDKDFSTTLPYSKNKSSTGAHEIGHSLGIEGHTDGTLMSESQDNNRTLDINQQQINSIVESEVGQDSFFHLLGSWTQRILQK